ncbi:SDR family oxidoreductase [Nocardia niigatensis]|uniref:SDR family oxidoreductase n=1 Tax=Nocardia niigatensis TaxID=209249 RepID=UPI00030A9DEE|nr:SDR family oxidoreductase [Nocardia niigatensis]
MPTSHSLRSKRVVITGAGRGIGLATAHVFLTRGARVVIGDIDLDAAEASAERLGAGTIALPLDVTDVASFDTFVGKAESSLGGIDVLVNNAGVMPIGPFLELSAQTEARSLQINVLGVLTGMRLALRRFVAQGHGHLVNVASTAGLAPIPGGVTYCAEKAAIIHATEAARVEFGSDRIRFSCVMPAFTNTELVSGTAGLKLIRNVEPSEVAEAIAEAVETGRKDVFVPRVLGPLLKTQPLLGRHIRDVFNRRTGAYDTFLTIDHSARAAYDARVENS